MLPSDRQACISTVIRFFGALDNNAYEDMMAMMSTDAQWHRQGEILRPGQAMLDALNRRSPTRTVIHVLTNLDARERGEGQIVVTGYSTAFQFDDGQHRSAPLPLDAPSSISAVHVKLKQVSAVWKLALSKSRPLFRRSAG